MRSLFVEMLGSVIKRRAEEQGDSVSEMAHIAGISDTDMYEFLVGRICIRYDKLYLIAHALGTTADELIEEAIEKYKPYKKQYEKKLSKYGDFRDAFGRGDRIFYLTSNNQIKLATITQIHDQTVYTDVGSFGFRWKDRTWFTEKETALYYLRTKKGNAASNV